MLRLADRVPCDVDAIYIPGFGLTLNKKRLTSINQACMERAGQIQNRAKHFIFAGCYGGEALKLELALRQKIADKYGVKDAREIRGIVDTRDELIKLASVLNELGAESVLMVSDEYHMPRLVRWAQRYLPGIKIFHMSVKAPKYEFTWEPNLIKVIRSGIKPLWILWNVLLCVASPLLLHE